MTNSASGVSRKRAPLAERVWRYVDRRDPKECWPWTGKSKVQGYGVIGLGSRAAGKEQAHRVIWRIANGPIPRIGNGYHGGVIRHKCNNRLCCNPAHLDLGTQADNVADMWKNEKARGNARLTNAQVDAIRSDARSSRQIAPDFGVCDAHIRAIRRGRAWATL